MQDGFVAYEFPPSHRDACGPVILITIHVKFARNQLSTILMFTILTGPPTFVYSICRGGFSASLLKFGNSMSGSIRARSIGTDAGLVQMARRGGRSGRTLLRGG